MATERQVDLIEQLMDELGFDREDLADEDPVWGVYERVSPADASELIEWMREAKRSSRA